jgi:hypothetical protein
MHTVEQLRRTRQRLNGWHRLWIVAVVLWGIVIGFKCWQTMPRPKPQTGLVITGGAPTLNGQRFTADSDTLELFGLRSKENLEMFGRSYKLVTYRKDSGMTGQLYFQPDTPDADLRKILTGNPWYPGETRGDFWRHVQSIHVVDLMVFEWVVPAVGLYLVGHVIAWIRRGIGVR